MSKRRLEAQSLVFTLDATLRSSNDLGRIELVLNPDGSVTWVSLDLRSMATPFTLNVIVPADGGEWPDEL